MSSDEYDSNVLPFIEVVAFNGPGHSINAMDTLIATTLNRIEIQTAFTSIKTMDHGYAGTLAHGYMVGAFPIYFSSYRSRQQLRSVALSLPDSVETLVVTMPKSIEGNRLYLSRAAPIAVMSHAASPTAAWTFCQPSSSQCSSTLQVTCQYYYLTNPILH
jgi:hypothetical protein